MKRVLLLILIVVLCVGSSFGLTLIFQDKEDLFEANLNFEPDRPDFEAMDPYTIPTDKDALAELIYLIYSTANANDQEVDGRMYYSYCPTHNVAAGMDNQIDLHIMDIKDGSEWFRIDYRVKKDIPIFQMLPALAGPLNNKLELVVTEKKYAKDGMDQAYYQKVKNSYIDDKGMVGADWSKPSDIFSNYVKYKPFNINGDGQYFKADHTVNESTIITDTVSLKKVDNYYVANFELDCTNSETTFGTAQAIKDGSGDPGAKYVKIEMEMTVWDNGYFRSFKTKEKWTAKAIGMIEIESTFEYSDVYSYQKERYDLTKYADAQSIRELCANGAPKL